MRDRDLVANPIDFVAPSSVAPRPPENLLVFFFEPQQTHLTHPLSGCRPSLWCHTCGATMKQEASRLATPTSAKGCDSLWYWRALCWERGPLKMFMQYRRRYLAWHSQLPCLVLQCGRWRRASGGVRQDDRCGFLTGDTKVARMSTRAWRPISTACLMWPDYSNRQVCLGDTFLGD